MRDIFGPGGPREPRDPLPQINLENLDFSKITRMIKGGLIVLAVILLWSGLSWGQRFYTDWLWFSDLGYQEILLTMVSTRVVLYLLAVVIFFALAVPSLFMAWRITDRMQPYGGVKLPPDIYSAARKVLMLVAAGVVILAAFTLAGQPASEWETMLRYLNGVAFNATDPIFERDISFYVFTLPVLEFLRFWLLSVVLSVFFIVGAFYYVNSSLRGEMFTFTRQIRAHLAILGAMLFLLIAAGHWLGRYELLYSPTGAVFGMGSTDSTVTLPARTLLTFVALATAGVLLASIFSSKKRLAVWAVGIWFGLNILGGTAAPMFYQRMYVEPSELARERDFLANNISATREAFGLTELQTRTHPALGWIDPETVEENQGTVRNIRLWDEGPLLQSYNQIQFFRLYYDFLAVHTDRYTVNDELRQVMLATRELSAEKLPSEAQRWVNRHLQFTHGFGVAMTPVTEVDEAGRPGFFVSDIPPRGEIELNRPEVYFGLKSLDYLIVRTDTQEFNFPGPDGSVYTSYDGDGGVELSSFFRKFMYAWQFRDLNILISGEINPDSLIQYRRTIRERFTTVSPFLLRDREAYSVVADGRLFWIQDAYTTTNRYPYSTPYQGQFNYLRNSVKAVVDAYHGTIDYYIADYNDPIVRTYDAIFPGLFKPMEEMPDYLRPHLRYPQDGFSVQTQMLLQYHMEDPVVFYNREDQWSLPVQHSFGRTEILRPYYIVARLPGEPREEFLLIQPFTPVNRHNLVGWIAARMDGENYGEMILYRFPRGRHVDGPNQVEARIDNDAIISEQFTLWGQVGSEVFRGILLVIPLGDSLLYAEPVFLRPDTLEFPELRRIILADARQVVMHRTLDQSILALVGELPAVAPVVELEEEIFEPAIPPLPFEGLEAVREGLREAVEKLQEVLDQLGRVNR